MSSNGAFWPLGNIATIHSLADDHKPTNVRIDIQAGQHCSFSSALPFNPIHAHAPFNRTPTSYNQTQEYKKLQPYQSAANDLFQTIIGKHFVFFSFPLFLLFLLLPFPLPFLHLLMIAHPCTQPLIGTLCIQPACLLPISFNQTQGLTPKIILAYILLPFFMAPLESGAAAKLDVSWETFDWVLPIAIRDLVGSYVICFGWEWLL